MKLPHRRRNKQRRPLQLESLEQRRLLAVDGIFIDLRRGGSIDLFNPTPGALQSGFVTNGVGVTIGTANIPGQNNQPPVAADDSLQFSEDATSLNVTSQLLANDSDVDTGDTLTITAASSAAKGHVSLVSGAVSYDPNGQFESLAAGVTATDLFTYTISDGHNTAVTGTATVTIVGTNDAPVLDSIGDRLVVEEALLSFSATANDVDVSDELTFSLENAPTGASITETGVFSWTPNEQQGPATYTFSIVVSDNASPKLSDSETITVTVAEANKAPTVSAQSYGATGNVPIQVGAGAGLLVGAVDVDIPLNTLSVSSVDATSANGGTITSVDLATGAFTYVSAPGFEGIDTFAFTVTDGSATVTQTATVTVSDTIWFVDNSAAPGGNGTMLAPFDSFTPLNDDGNDLDEPGDVIYVATGAAIYNVTRGNPNVHDHGFELEDGQFVIGQGAKGATLASWLSSQTDVEIAALSATLPPIGGTNPHITNTSGDVFTAASGNLITGVTLDPVASAGIAGEGVEDLVVEFVIIITSGGTNNNEGINLKTVTGRLTFKNVNIGSAVGGTNNGPAIQIDGGTAELTFDDVDIDQSGGTLLNIINTFSSTLVFDDKSQLKLRNSDRSAVTISGNDGGTVILNNDGLDVETQATVVFNVVDNRGFTARTPVNDAPSFTLPPQAPEVFEDSGPQVINGFASHISPGPDANEADQTVAFTVLADPGLFAVQPAIDASGNLTYTPADNAFGTTQITVQLQDDGGTEKGGVDRSDVKTFSIVIKPVNDPPKFTLGPNPAAIPEDAAPQTINGFARNLHAGPTNETGQLLNFEIIGNSNPALFATGPTINPVGKLTYTPAPNANGVATITVGLRDDGGDEHGGIDRSLTQTFDITIAPAVNDPPTFDLPASIGADLHAGSRTVNGFVSNIHPGPQDEASQTVSLAIIGNDNASIFATQPTIDNNGTLTFAPAANGSATITVQATDNGGTDFGGNDTSPPRTFTITISEGNVAPVLDAIGNRSVNEETLLSFSATATDPNEAADGLNYSLDGPIPSGASITPAGVFSWTPAGSQVGIHFIDIVVTDNGSPAKSDRETITVTVNDVVLPTIADVKFEIVQGNVGGETKYGSYFYLDAVGEGSSNASRIDLRRVNDTAFSRPDSKFDDQQVGYQYDSLAEFLAAHNGVHQFGIDLDGDGDYESTFTIDVDLNGFTTASFPNYANITAPIGTINSTTPTITWDAISGAESLYISTVKNNQDLDEVWFTHPELPGGATSVTAGTQPTGEPLFAAVQANFRRDDLASSSSDDGAVTLSFYTSSIATTSFEIPAPPTSSSDVADIYVEVIEANIGGELVYFASMQVEIAASQFSSPMQVMVKGPNDTSFREMRTAPDPNRLTEGRWVRADIEPDGDGSLGTLLNWIDGTYVVQVNFGDDTTIGLEFEFSLDTSGLDANDFADAPTNVSPGTGQTIGIDQREVTITWEEDSTADFIIVQILAGDTDGPMMFESDVPIGTKQVTTNLMPSGIDLVMPVIANKVHDIATTTDPIDVAFVMGAAALWDFNIAEQLKSATPINPSGFYGGGPDVLGGVAFEFDGLAGSAEVMFEYQPTRHTDQWWYVAGGQTPGSQLHGAFSPTGDGTLQAWLVQVTDESYDPIGFNHVDLTLHYDPSQFDAPSYGVNIEQHLGAYQYDSAAGEWVELTLLAQNFGDDTMTVRATDEGSYIVLGYDPSEVNSAPYFPAGQIGYSQMEVVQANGVADQQFYVGNLDLQGLGPNIQQQSRLLIKQPGETTFTLFDDGNDNNYAYVFLGEQYTSLAELIAARHGTYEVQIDYENDGTPDDSFSVTFDLSGLTESSLPDAPAITSPTSTSVVTTGQPTNVAWALQPEADSMFAVVQVANGPGLDDNEELFERNFAESTTAVEIDGLPAGKELMLFVGANQMHNQRASGTSTDGTVRVELELTAIQAIYFGGSSLRAANGQAAPSQASSAVALTKEQLAPIVDEAIRRLESVGNFCTLTSVDFEVADLPGDLLGSSTRSTVVIDVNAAGHGWFLDLTPSDDVEFQPGNLTLQLQKDLDGLKGRFDLLTVVMHELGHTLGLEHSRAIDELMSESLAIGERRLPTESFNDDLLDLLAEDAMQNPIVSQ